MSAADLRGCANFEVCVAIAGFRVWEQGFTTWSFGREGFQGLGFRGLELLRRRGSNLEPGGCWFFLGVGGVDSVRLLRGLELTARNPKP